MQTSRYRGLGKVNWITMIILLGIAQYYPDAWIGRNIGLLMLVFGLNAYAALSMATEDTNNEIEVLKARLENLSRELKSLGRGLENVHDRLWKVEHKHDDPWSYDEA